MTVPKELQEKWKSLYSVGDFEAIAEKAGLSAQTVRFAFKYGECTTTVFEAIAGFYKERDEKVNEYLK